MLATRYLLRRIFRSPGFSTMVVATIALGMGVNIGIFSITKAIFLNSLGVSDASRLVYYTLGNGPDMRLKFSQKEYEALASALGTKELVNSPMIACYTSGTAYRSRD